MSVLVKIRSLIIVLISGLFFISAANAQDNIHYKFKVSEVNSLATAKSVIAVIRSSFNTEDEPNKHYPTFDIATNKFDFSAAVLVNRSDLSELLSRNGYALLEFESEIVIVK